MKELIYSEIPTPDTKAVHNWLKNIWQPKQGKKFVTPDGIRLQFETGNSELSIFAWQLQRTTYLKVFHRCVFAKSLLKYINNESNNFCDGEYFLVKGWIIWLIIYKN